MAITSGGLEPVWDGGGAEGHSVFAAAFINALDGHIGPISATEIFQQVREPVLRRLSRSRIATNTSFACHHCLIMSIQILF